jgi:hypothetical protein
MQKSITSSVVTTAPPTTAQIREAADLFLAALIDANIPIVFVENKALKAWVKFISNDRFSVPSRHVILQRLSALVALIRSVIKTMLNERRRFVSFEQDAWTKGNVHINALTTGDMGLSAFIGAYDLNAGEESAVKHADAIHAQLLSALGLDPDLDKYSPEIPVGKVCNMTSDTTALMPAIGRVLQEEYPLCKDMTWTPCLPHMLNLYIGDQSCIMAIAECLSFNKKITLTFKQGAARKLLVMCALHATT